MLTTTNNRIDKTTGWRSFGRAALFVCLFLGGQTLFSMITTVIVANQLGATDADRLMEAVLRCSSWIAVIGNLLSVLVALLIVYLCRGNVLHEIALVPPHGAKPILQAALLGAGFCGVVSYLLAVIPLPEAWMETYQESSESVVSGIVWLDVLATVIVAPLTEEIIMRGLAYRALKEGMPTVLSVLIVSIAFGLMHGQIVWMLYTFLMSLVCIALLEHTGTLWAPIALHTAFNIVGQLPLLMEDASDIVVALYYYGLSALFVLVAVWIFADRRRAKQPPA